MSNVYNLFISHSWTYGAHYDGLLNLLRQRSHFFFKDHSVPKYDPIHYANNDKQLSETIYYQMYSCHVVLIMAGVYSTYSK